MTICYDDLYEVVKSKFETQMLGINVLEKATTHQREVELLLSAIALAKVTLDVIENHEEKYELKRIASEAIEAMENTLEEFGAMHKVS